VATISFSEERVRLREGLLRLVDAGVSVRAAAESLGVSTGSAYWMLRGAGQLAGMRRVITDAHRARVVEVSDASGSVNRAASVSKLGYPVARRILVEAGRVSAQPRPRGKAAARARFRELVGQGWSSARAAREVGVNERTARDWRNGVHRANNTRTYPNGVVVDSRSATRYTTAMKPPEPARISDRYLSLDDRLAIADGLIVQQSLTRIAERIGKRKSTVSREVRAHRVDGVYLPHQAAAQARTRPKGPNCAQHGVARTGRARPVPQVVSGADLQSAPQGLRRGREHAGEPRDDLPGAVRPGPRRSEARGPARPAHRANPPQAAATARAAHPPVRRGDGDDQRPTDRPRSRTVRSRDIGRGT